MGFKNTKLVMDKSKAKGPARLVMMVIAHMADDKTNECWPYNETLGRYCNMSARQVSSAIKNLRAIGEIKRKQTRRGAPITTITLAPAKEISGEKKYTLKQLRGAYGAGYYTGAEKQPEAIPKHGHCAVTNRPESHDISGYI